MARPVSHGVIGDAAPLPWLQTLLILLVGCYSLVPIPIAKALSSSPSLPSKKQKDIRLVTWNVLAPQFSHPKKYPWCASEHLSWPYREELIQSELARIDADIVCLQEIQTDVWEDFMHGTKYGLGDRYEGVLQNVTNDHPVTNAVLLRKNKFRVERQESRSRALILVLSQIDGEGDNAVDNNTSDEVSRTSRPLYLANVHLQAGIDDDETRVCQLKSLLKRLVFHSNQDEKQSERTSKRKKLKDKLKRKLKSKLKLKSSKRGLIKELQPPTPPAAVIIAGDMNMLPTNPVYRWLSHKEHETASSTSTTQQAPEVHMLDSGTGLELKDLKFPARGKHVELLPLRDVYRDSPPVLFVEDGHSDQQQQHTDNNESKEEEKRRVQMTYCGGSVLDYIWTTDSSTSNPSIDISRTMVFQHQAFQEDRQQWPSKDHPSDHLPVGFEFSWH